MDAAYPKRGSRPARTGNVRRGFVLLRISSPVWRACPQKVGCSRACPYQHLRRVWRERQALLRVELLSGVHLRARKSASLKQEEPSRGAAVSLEREPHLGYLPQKAGQQTGKDGKREGWRRTSANLSSELESMPPDSRVLESMPIPAFTTSLAKALNASAYEVVVRSAFAGSYFRVAVSGGTEQGGRSIPVERTSSWIRSTQRGAADRQGQET